MRISELSRRSGVPTATIKFYLREGLMPPGRATSATQAEYDESHLRRLRLVRALIGARGLSVSAAKEIVGSLSEVEGDTYELLGLVFGVWPGAGGGTDTGAGQGAKADGDADSSANAGQDAEVDALIAELGWDVTEFSPARKTVTRTLNTLRGLGIAYDWRALLPYARLAERTAALDLDQIEGPEDPLEKAERAVQLTFLLEPALLALRRLAQESEAAARYRGPSDRP
ncbi:MerR family transcriptional regulator [Streptomyces flavofungini]|uniref:MerR family transcriptional regulator n=1 Tax=Streptomyces flavofungini TaxID=68200 RepID=A0ABS0XIF5_9ACTN|nr:MerR family transcriptional regulator [Streptomyces flavofungini]MBJ3813000.1 MerR family transcriptional regulator [Streptomyces flavofungini]GHC43201.1 transcriptional regulator [Streptomyces flavofungini]